MSDFKRYFTNTSWLIFEKILRIVLTLGITIWLARYLGPNDFGILNYVLAFVSIFGIFSTLGFDKTVSKQLIINDTEQSVIMGSSFIITFISSILLIPIMLIFIYIIRNDNEEIIFYTLILSFSFIFNSLSIIKYFFETNAQAKYNVMVESSVIILSTIVKSLLIIYEVDLIVFVYIILLESVLTSIGFIIIYIIKGNKINKWKISFIKSFNLIKESYPVILSGAVFMLFTRIDQIMIGNLIDDSAVGIYSAAVKLSEGWIFVPAVIATSLFPYLLKTRKNNIEKYLLHTQHLLNIIAFLGIFVALVITFISPLLIELIYGEKYHQASLVLTIHIWAMLFNALSIISSRYFLTEGLQIYSFYRAIIGLILNVILNYFLIPYYGITGAAIATVISQFLAAYILNSTNAKTRQMFYMQTISLNIFNIYKTLIFINDIRKKR